MAALRETARLLTGRKGDLEDRVDGLDQAVEATRGRLGDDLVDATEAVVRRAQGRLRLSADHTIVALAGATGSGKSSTFNALAGLDLAAVGVRRPTTSWATACVWGDLGAGSILDWLGIPERHRVVRDSMLDAGRGERDLKGLVLLDLPDHDSTEVSHHLEMDRLVEQADLVVWVLDPQKYADAVIHDRYLAPMAAHGDVMVVVLNHLDEVAPERRAGMLADIARLLDQDGLSGIPLLAMSAETGEGVAELRDLVARRVADKAAAKQRLAADVRAAADRLAAATGDAEPRMLSEADRDALASAVGEAAGVPVVVDAVRRSALARARRATGWPLTRWLGRLRPDPLKRLHLDLGSDGRDLVVAARSSLPAPDAVQRAKVESAVRACADRLSEGLTPAWAGVVRRASTARSADLGDRLDRAVTSTDLGRRTPPWWARLVDAVQWVLILAALAGALWLAVLALMGYLQVSRPHTPKMVGVPLPTLLLIGGIVLGVLLALVCRLLVRSSARSRSARARRRLDDAVRDVTEELVVTPMAEELAAYRSAVEGLRRARA